MTYATEKNRLGRVPFIRVTLRMGYCANVYGSAPCTASGAVGTECYNTRATCQDSPNYVATTKDYTFCTPTPDLPRGAGMFPFVKGGVEKSSNSITAGKGLGKRAVVRVDFNDAPHHDRGIDPYVATRTYDPMEQGTFWGKFLVRNPYYENKPIYIDYGYLTPEFLDTDFERQTFDIVDMSGINNGVISVTSKDMLVRTYASKAQYPPISSGKLLADITNAQGTAVLTPAGIGATDYPASGTLSIGKEAMDFTRSGDNLTLTTRNAWGTQPKAHKAGDTVQIAVVWNDVSIIDVLDELLVTGSGMPSAVIPTADWIVERDLWMNSSLVKGVLLKPEPVINVLEELTECFMFDMWWDSTNATVEIKALSPEPPNEVVPLLTEGKNVKQGTFRVTRKSKDRYTEVRVHHNKDDFSEKNELGRFGTININTNPDNASADKYGTNSIKDIFCRWFDSSALASQLAGRTLARFSDTPEFVEMELDQKDFDNVNLAKRICVDTWQLQDAGGANLQKKFQVTEIDEGRDPSHSFKLKAFTSSFSGRYWFIAPAGAPTYSLATEEEKANMAFICESNSEFLDGTDGYKII